AAVGAYPDIQKQVFSGDHLVADAGRASDVAIPAFEYAAINRANGKDVVPAVRIKIFGEVVARFKHGIAQVAGRPGPDGMDNPTIRQVLGQFCLIADHRLPFTIQFLNGHAHRSIYLVVNPAPARGLLKEQRAQTGRDTLRPRAWLVNAGKANG